ncbi:acyl-CoA reductase [Bernardetia sp.]|uniref:acyl-CoA reductase n=1 Tax=Bernardetia sp. TaxID=1937974 RepID=UPI0025C4DBFF|nr:acyl-CoA reductase [Bernardetia sp.]
MTLSHRKAALVALGNFIDTLSKKDKHPIFHRAYVHNNWFTIENIEFALASIRSMLTKDSLENWLSNYNQQALEEVGTKIPSKNIGIIMAGNIPFVGFHDMLTVLLSGHNVWIKPSQKDTILIEKLLEWMFEVEPTFKEHISLRPNLKGADAYIATGSNNSARYFEYYFGKFPSIIRKNRSSVAIIKGDETQEELERLSIDIFQYFGLGCRNVSKLYVPEGYDFGKLLDTVYLQWNEMKNHNKYANNYDYYKAIYLMEQIHHFDAFNILLTKDTSISSPTGVLYYEIYQDIEEVKQIVTEKEEQIQVIVSANAWFENSIDFGQAQHPKVYDYADGVDTMKFLLEL